MNKTIYHGASKIVRSPKFGAGRPYNDFGLGFYCSEYPQHAAEWAVSRGSNGFVSTYSIDNEGLRIINLCSNQYTPLHWISLLFNYREFDTSSDIAYRAKEYINRFFSVDHQGCDCIIGWRADNRCFMFAQEFLNGSVSYQRLKSVLSDDSNRQFVLKSNRAFDRLSFSGYEPALREEHFPVIKGRELRSIKESSKASVKHDPGLFVTDLIEEEVRHYDTRLR